MLQKIYTIWCFFVLVASFLSIFPAIWLCLQYKAWYPHTHTLHQIWAWLFFRLSFLPVKVTYQFKPKANEKYIFCANHSSYLDIPAVTYAVPHFFKFVGKNDIANVPLFGLMFRKVHIGVDRGKLRSRYDAMQQADQALKENYSLLIYPEGGFSPKAPQLMPFKDGAFRLAIENKTAIVPISLLTNYKIMPDKQPLLIYRYPIQIVVHPPIATADLTLEDLPKLKQQTAEVIINAK
jgi:1-acyl-sn-glycerol-3-phosphate acyltransferase